MNIYITGSFCSYFQFVFFQMLGSYYLSFIIWRTVVRWYGINKRTSWTPPSKRLTLESMYPIKFAWPFKFDCEWKKMRLFISNNFPYMVCSKLFIGLSNHDIKFKWDLPRLQFLFCIRLNPYHYSRKDVWVRIFWEWMYEYH